MSGHPWQGLDRTLMACLLISVLWLVVRSYEVGEQERAEAVARFKLISGLLEVNHELLQANRAATTGFVAEVGALCVATGAKCPSLEVGNE